MPLMHASSLPAVAGFIIQRQPHTRLDPLGRRRYMWEPYGLGDGIALLWISTSLSVQTTSLLHMYHLVLRHSSSYSATQT